MLPTTARFYNPAGPDRVASVAVQRATDPELWVIEARRGVSAKKLRPATTHGPYTAEQVAAQFKDITDSLKAEGFLPAGLPALFEALESPNPAHRAHAAIRLGWRRERSAVDRLLTLLPNAVDETCSVVDALGMIGDERAVPALRQQAARKLLSRRRSAAEALRQIGDAEAMAEVRQLALDRLPDEVRSLAEADPVSPQALVEAVQGLEVSQQGLAADTLYELGTLGTVEAARRILLGFDFGEAHRWRYVKSVFKRSILRHDYATFGLLAYEIEARGASKWGTTATVKSGYDGKQRSVRIFARNTQNFLRRLSWRYLVDLARYRPEAYPHAAAEAIIHYPPQPVPPGAHPHFYSTYRFYLFNRVLYSAGTRLRYESRSLNFWPVMAKHVEPKPGAREEMFPELWDAQPDAFLRILAAAKRPEPHAFAVAAIQARHKDLIQSATPANLVAMLRAPYEPTVVMALNELERRFDPAHPDWDLLAQIVQDERPLARKIAQRWLRLTAIKWTGSAGLVLTLLTRAQGDTRDLVYQLTRSRLGEHPELRRALADLIAVALEQPEHHEGTHEVLARLAAEALVQELEEIVSVERLLSWATHGAPAAKGLAGQLLALRPQAAAELGLERIIGLAQHEVASVRAAAAALLNASFESLKTDPSALFVLVESDWDDTRSAAFALVRKLDPASLGLDGLMGLLDSNRAPVQKLGQEVAAAHFGSFPAEELVYRLLQHPHHAMRQFTLDLVVKHLPPGEGPLAKLRDFCRAAVLDLWPQRAVKRRVMDFLQARGLEDERQAALVASAIGDMVRLQGRADRERALEALVRIRLAFPDVPSTVKVLPEGLT